LVLVSEQRIDLPRSPAPAVSPVSVVASQGTVQPVRPRRIVVSRPAASAAPAAALQTAPLVPTEPEPDDTLIDHEIAEIGDIDMGADSLDNIFTSDAARSFADFAEDLGVLDLSELLEAAAVYNTLVLNKPEFTRAQLFRQVEDMTKEEAPALEEVLTEFGDLLREGRMQKMRRGTYAVGPTSPLMVEARKIAG
jgi:hypothetical protein